MAVLRRNALTLHLDQTACKTLDSLRLLTDSGTLIGIPEKLEGDRLEENPAKVLSGANFA